MQTADEQRDRQAFEASIQQVPAGIQAQKAHPPTGVCHVCFIEDYTDDNLLLEVPLPLLFASLSQHVACSSLSTDTRSGWNLNVVSRIPALQHLQAYLGFWDNKAITLKELFQNAAVLEEVSCVMCVADRYGCIQAPYMALQTVKHMTLCKAQHSVHVQGY